MILASVLIAVAVIAGFATWWIRRERGRRLVAEHTITAEELHGLLETEDGPLLFDVRFPLDVLAYSEEIAGSVRITPKEIQANPSLIPRDKDAVVYCTCPGDESSRIVLEKARSLHYVQLRLLRGGLEAWKAKGYPVERYDTVFHLDTPA